MLVYLYYWIDNKIRIINFKSVNQLKLLQLEMFKFEFSEFPVILCYTRLWLTKPKLYTFENVFELILKVLKLKKYK